jgi:L-2-hydroxyglutarate oxidase LhgO
MEPALAALAAISDSSRLQMLGIIGESLHYVAMDNADVVVIGAGVIGLAVARAFAYRGREVLVLEAAEAFGTETSSRNSEVIHAGIYYPAGSLKAQLCVAGRELLYDFCARHGVPHRRCGKLIVATSEAQVAQLEQIQAAAARNGVDLDLLSREQALSLEPRLTCHAALQSPTTGIVDSHSLMLALLGQAENRGASLVCESRVTHLSLESGGVAVGVNGDEPLLLARTVINCAGLRAPELARSIVGFPAQHVPRAYFAKGSYFTLSGPSPFTHLIYPVPEHGGLGVHLTLDLAGRARFGPDVQWVERCEYGVEPQRSERFYAAIRAYWPELPDGALQPAYAGIRPKISGPTEAAADFCISGPAVHGVAHVVNLFGIESPGLTASLALAEKVVSSV